MKLYKTEGIILKKTNFGEADLILTVLTKDIGKISILAKGARRPQSRFGGRLELFLWVRLLLVVSRSGLDIISEVTVLRYFRKIRDNLTKTGLAFYLAELVDKFLPPKEENYKVFKLLVKIFSLINQREVSFVLIHYFEIRLVELLGFKPEFRYCIGCSKLLQKESCYFSFEGGIVCCKCQNKVSRKVKISSSTLKFLRVLECDDLNLILKLKLPPAILYEASKILINYLEFITERRLKSKKFLKSLKLVEKPKQIKDN